VSLLRAALAYAAHGWAIFPVRGKVPLTARGLLDATTDAAVVSALFTDSRVTGVAISCGASGLLVVDLDGDAGHAAWADLAARHGGHPHTLTAETGKPGGPHLYFSGSGRSSAGKLGAEIDTRGDGGYVVAPPSLHPSGRRYRWIDPKAPLAAVPEWLPPLLKPPPPPVTGERRDIPNGVTATVYGRATLVGLATEMLETPEGERNEKLVRLAYRAGRLCAGGELDRDAARDVLLEAALRAGLSYVEASRTITSGLGAGERFPLGRSR
jgi:hypothetical protein